MLDSEDHGAPSRLCQPLPATQREFAGRGRNYEPGVPRFLPSWSRPMEREFSRTSFSPLSCNAQLPANRNCSGIQAISGFRVDPRLGHFHCVDFGLINDLEIANRAGEQLMAFGATLPRHVSVRNPGIRF